VSARVVSTSELRARVPAYARRATLSVALAVDDSAERIGSGGSGEGSGDSTGAGAAGAAGEHAAGEPLALPNDARVTFTRFDSFEPPTVSAVHPRLLAVSAARATLGWPTTLTLTGGNFPPLPDGISCDFGEGRATPARVTAVDSLECAPPDLGDSQTVAVR
jgi:hypothetical protein